MTTDHDFEARLVALADSLRRAGHWVSPDPPRQQRIFAGTVAALLGLSAKTVRNLSHLGALEPIATARRAVYLLADVLRYRDQRETDAAIARGVPHCPAQTSRAAPYRTKLEP